VYDNGEEIAVKLLHNNMPGMDDGLFQKEYENLMRLNHHNVVRLVGYCYESHYHPFQYKGKTVFAEKIFRALCFEYMKNGSLQKHLSGTMVPHLYHLKI
jgi:serine/threonine protein kinase